MGFSPQGRKFGGSCLRKRSSIPRIRTDAGSGVLGANFEDYVIESCMHSILGVPTNRHGSASAFPATIQKVLAGRSTGASACSAGAAVCEEAVDFAAIAIEGASEGPYCQPRASTCGGAPRGSSFAYMKNSTAPPKKSGNAAVTGLKAAVQPSMQ